MITPPDGYLALTQGAGYLIDRHAGQFEATGSDANACINRVVTADLSRLHAGHGVATLLLRDDGSIQARLMVYRFADRILLVTASTTRAVLWQELLAHKRGQVRLRDISEDTSLLQVRGPRAAALLDTSLMPLPIEAGSVTMSRCASVDVFAARATTEGADGIDLHCRARDLTALETILQSAGIAPIAPDVWEIARLEWGIAEVGIEIDPSDTPVEAGLEDLVMEGKGAPFPGEFAVASRRRSGPMRRLVGVQIAGEVLPPIGAAVQIGGLDGERLRSVTISPRAGMVGIVAVPASATAIGTSVTISADGMSWQGRVVRRPFVTRADV